jgi:hypothetical protein
MKWPRVTQSRGERSLALMGNGQHMNSFRWLRFAYVLLFFSVNERVDAQALGVNPSAAASDVRNPSSTNPSAAASDIRNPSAINPQAPSIPLPPRLKSLSRAPPLQGRLA